MFEAAAWHRDDAGGVQEGQAVEQVGCDALLLCCVLCCGRNIEPWERVQSALGIATCKRCGTCLRAHALMRYGWGLFLCMQCMHMDGWGDVILSRRSDGRARMSQGAVASGDAR